MIRLLWLPFFAGLTHWCIGHVGIGMFRNLLTVMVDLPTLAVSRNSVECSVILLFGLLASGLTWRKR